MPLRYQILECIGDGLSVIDAEILKSASLMVGGGYYDIAMNPGKGPAGNTLPYLLTKLADLEVPFGYYVAEGGHDWTTWPQLLKIFAENYLWK